MVGYRNRNVVLLRRNQIVSGIPMVGYRNITGQDVSPVSDCIRHSDGGVSELWHTNIQQAADCIRHSDGGVSEQEIPFTGT